MSSFGIGPIIILSTILFTPSAPTNNLEQYLSFWPSYYTIPLFGLAVDNGAFSDLQGQEELSPQALKSPLNIYIFGYLLTSFG